jgi:PAS domain S-box-containing protein
MGDVPERPDLTGLSQLRRHLDRLHAAGGLTPELVVQDLETVYEELRTSEEEVRVQQEHIARLVADQADDHRQHERLFALLPVAVLTTDTLGVVRTANGAAAALLRVPGERLAGKPVFTMVAPDDRPELRRRLAAGVRHAVRQVVTVLRRDGSAVEVEVLITARPGPWPELCWVLLVGEGGNNADRPGREQLAAALMRLTGVLGAADLTGLLTAAAPLVRDGLGAASVSICVGSPLEPIAVGTTDGLAATADGAQIAAGDGPALAAYSDDVTVVTTDLRTDARWPKLAHLLPEGAGPVVAAPLRVAGDVTGILAAYLSPGRGAAEAEPAVELLADTVAAIVAEWEAKTQLASLAADLRTAMESRAVIEQAKGIVMAERGCDDDEAFAHLVRLSSTTHVKLRELARTVVARASAGGSRGAGTAGGR